MKTYRIKASSWVMYILTLSLVIFLCVLVFVQLRAIVSLPLAVVSIIILVGGAFYLTRFTAVAITEWKMDENKIQLKWLSQFLLHKRPDLTIYWVDIIEYKYQPDKNFDLLRIKLNDGRIIRLWHSTTTSNDDFDKFVRSFEKRVHSLNEGNNIQANRIKRAKTLYETNFALVLAIIFALAL